MCEALSEADAVVICTAGDESSFHMISAAEIAAMKPSALVVNVARGEIIDEAALIAALQENRVEEEEEEQIDLAQVMRSMRAREDAVGRMGDALSRLLESHAAAK